MEVGAVLPPKIKIKRRLKMSFKKTYHKNALLKLVKEQRMILQTDAADRMNRERSTLNNTAQILEQEGKIKRQKVKVRMQNGNLNDSWLLYMSTVKQNEILEYEKELINRPYTSPLKEHHCYKKIENEPTSIMVNKSSNVVDMADYVKVNNQELPIKEYEGGRVVTVQDIANLHNKQLKHVNEVFKNNKRHLIPNVDYFEFTRGNIKVGSPDLEKLFTSNRQKEAYLFTESGYLLLVKPFQDDLSWAVQRELVNTYFKMKELKQDQALANVPQIKDIQMLDVIDLMTKHMRNQDVRITQLEKKFSKLTNVLSS
jgi:DNA-binding Lrp family transcriptional regulator